MDPALWGTVMLEQKRAFPKLFPQSWKHRIVQHVMKLPVHSFGADSNARAGTVQLLSQQSFGHFYALCSSALQVWHVKSCPR